MNLTEKVLGSCSDGGKEILFMAALLLTVLPPERIDVVKKMKIIGNDKSQVRIREY